MKLLNKDEFIANEIKYYIIKNKIKEGDKMPSERELAEMFDVQRATIRAAYSILEEEGVIEIRGRSGRYMGHSRISTNLQQIKSFSDKIKKMGMEVGTKLLAFEVIETDKKLSKKIRLPIGTAVYKITRVRKTLYADKFIPVTIEYSYIPEAMAPRLIKYDLEECSLFDILIKEYGKIPRLDEQIIEIVYADEFEARTLKVDKLTALVKKEGFTYDADGNVIQYLHAVMNKEWVSFDQHNAVIQNKLKGVTDNGL